MGKDSAIEWTHHTFNPWVGCTKVSPGCKHCYAEHLMDTRLGRVNWGPGNPRSRTSEANWRKPLAWNRAAKEAGERHRVFCASLADVFDPEVDDEWRIDLFRLIFDTPHLDWLLLTKRPENVVPFMDDACWPQTGCPLFADKLPDNVWLGTSVEDISAITRIGQLLQVPAALHFLSCEPLLGEFNIQHFLGDYYSSMHGGFGQGIRWVIAGGESGPGARPMHPQWARQLRDQCVAAGVPFLFKQWGAWIPEFQMNGNREAHTAAWDRTEYHRWHLDEEQGAYRVGKKNSGRLLDGELWDQFPSDDP